MGFNNGFEHVRLENKWKKLRIQYREAGMSEEAIQEMYNFDVQVVNSEQRYYRHSKDLAFNDADTEDTHSNDRYEEAILMADTYRETKSRFTWMHGRASSTFCWCSCSTVSVVSQMKLPLL